MYVKYPHKRVLVELLSEEAVMDLVEKHGEDAIPAVFAMMVESSEWSTKDSYDFVMEHFEGVFEDLSDYVASLYFGHMERALTAYATEQQFSWPLIIEDMVSEFDWDTVADRTSGHDYFAYQTLFEDESRQYFVFKTDPTAITTEQE